MGDAGVEPGAAQGGHVAAQHGPVLGRIDIVPGRQQGEAPGRVGQAGNGFFQDPVRAPGDAGDRSL